MRTELKYTWEDGESKEWIALLSNADGLHFTIDEIYTWIRKKRKYGELTQKEQEILDEIVLLLNETLDKYQVPYPILS